MLSLVYVDVSLLEAEIQWKTKKKKTLSDLEDSNDWAGVCFKVLVKKNNNLSNNWKCSFFLFVPKEIQIAKLSNSPCVYVCVCFIFSENKLNDSLFNSVCNSIVSRVSIYFFAKNFPLPVPNAIHENWISIYAVISNFVLCVRNFFLKVFSKLILFYVCRSILFRLG